MDHAKHTSASDAKSFGVRNAGHDYSGVIVLRGVNFELRSGQVHALLGENGCGKSTLVKILAGAIRPAAGQLYIDDDAVHFTDPANAQSAGIDVVHQNYNVFPELSVTNNVLGTNPAVARRRWLLGSVNHHEMYRTVAGLFERLAIDINPTSTVRDLGPAERKFVEIARAMTFHPRFLILDEPTASLEPNSAERVLRLLDTLRHQGVGVAFVSHRLDEVLRIADHYTVLRDGELVAHGETAGMSETALARLMIGDRAQVSERRIGVGPGEARLLLRDVRVFPGGAPLNLTLRKGEILGLTGLVGSGAAELVKMVGGAVPMDGTLEIDGRTAKVTTPRVAQSLGIGYVPEDRKAVGLVLEHSVALNISLASLEAVARNGVVSHREVAARAQGFKERMDIRTTSVQAPVSSLSGGNQQKVMLAKWLASGVQILAVEEPTQGVDIGGKAQIHEQLRDFAANGGSVLVASTDVREIVTLADRVAIFRHGSVQGLLDAHELDETHITARGAMDAEHYLTELVEGEEPVTMEASHNSNGAPKVDSPKDPL